MIQKIKLTDFRNFKEKLIEFSPKVTLIIGPNASGKTNILEAINLVASGKSFRAKIEEEMISENAEIARVKAKTEEILEVVLTRGEMNLGREAHLSPKKHLVRKKLLVNGVNKRLIDFAGRFKTVIFGPWDLGLVTQSPSLRRSFLDAVLSQSDREYRRSNLSYEKGLRQRNRLLYRIREEGLSRSQLIFWDQLLIKNGDFISRKREEFINFVNQEPNFDNCRFTLVYDKSAISHSRLEQYAAEEVAAATTLVGPHRDDIQFKIQNSKFKIERDLSRFGSRGEQRMAVLWLKLRELEYIERQTGYKPTLLLDDIFSELDKAHREVVMKVIKHHQTVITTTELQYVKKFAEVRKIIL